MFSVKFVKNVNTFEVKNLILLLSEIVTYTLIFYFLSNSIKWITIITCLFKKVKYQNVKHNFGQQQY